MPPTKETGILSIAAIRRSKDKGAEYLFNEKQQIFMLPKTTKSEESSERLKQAFDRSMPIRVLLDSRRALIQKTEVPSPQQVEEFRRLRALLDKPDKVLPIDVEDIDPT